MIHRKYSILISLTIKLFSRGFLTIPPIRLIMGKSMNTMYISEKS